MKKIVVLFSLFSCINLFGQTDIHKHRVVDGLNSEDKCIPLYGDKPIDQTFFVQAAHLSRKENGLFQLPIGLDSIFLRVSILNLENNPTRPRVIGQVKDFELVDSFLFRSKGIELGLNYDRDFLNSIKEEKCEDNQGKFSIYLLIDLVKFNRITGEYEKIKLDDYSGLNQTFDLNYFEYSFDPSDPKFLFHLTFCCYDDFDGTGVNGLPRISSGDLFNDFYGQKIAEDKLKRYYVISLDGKIKREFQVKKNAINFMNDLPNKSLLISTDELGKMKKEMILH